MLVSVMLLVLSCIPFIYMYERKKPKAREIVLIALMCALTVVSNILCAYTVPLHAGTAMVIICGIALGPQTGFLIGTLSRFVCNFFMGQGVWTVWEMFAWGLLGLLAGAMFSKIKYCGHLDDKKNIIKDNAKEGAQALLMPIACVILFELSGYIIYLFVRKSDDTFFGWWIYAFGAAGIISAVCLRKRRLPANFITMSIFTFVSIFIIYGGIMNLGAFFMTGAEQTKSMEALKLLYIAGIPYDFIHALTASACTFLMGENIVRKLERIKIKYGMYKGRSL